MSVNGTRTTGGIGASFIAQGGGLCDPENEGSEIFKDQTYGEFDMVPDDGYLSKMYSQMGSCGKQDDVETAGGGRIVVIADSVTFSGPGDKLAANARPYEDFERK